VLLGDATSWNRSGKAAWNFDRPVPVGIPAVIATMRGRASPIPISSATKTEV